MENSNITGSAKRTLINSIERLNGTINRLDMLTKLSVSLVNKFERKDDESLILEGSIKECVNKIDIIEMLDLIDERLNALINNAGANIQKVVDMID